MNGSNSTEMDVDSTMMPPTIYYSLPPMPWFGMDIGKNKIPKKPHEINIRKFHFLCKPQIQTHIILSKRKQVKLKESISRICLF